MYLWLLFKVLLKIFFQQDFLYSVMNKTGPAGVMPSPGSAKYLVYTVLYTRLAGLTEPRILSISHKLSSLGLDLGWGKIQDPDLAKTIWN
jgi:hypothetical protein